MSTRFTLLVAAAAVAFVLLGCASNTSIEVGPPYAEVGTLESTLMTPEVVEFTAKVVVHNRTGSAMDFNRVDYAVDLFDSQLFNDSFADLKRTNSGGRLTITLPFQIAVDDIVKSAVDLLDEGSMRVTFSGEVYPAPEAGYEALPFEATVVIPIPRIPVVTFRRTEGVPFTDLFRVVLDVRNLNQFALTVDSVESHIDINDHRYPLLYTTQATEIPASGSGSVVLEMEQTPGRTLSMILNAAQSEKPSFSLGGSITAWTEYGWIYIPVEIADRTLGQE